MLLTKIYLYVPLIKSNNITSYLLIQSMTLRKACHQFFHVEFWIVQIFPLCLPTKNHNKYSIFDLSKSMRCQDHICPKCLYHGLRTPREEKAFTARPKIHSHSQIFRYGRSIFCLPLQPNFSDIFDLCLHWVSVVRGLK